MTVNVDLCRIDYVGAGTVGPFQVPFYVLQPSDLLVVKTLLADGSSTTLFNIFDYTVNGLPSGVATITLAVALANTYRITIVRDPDRIQSSLYTEHDKFPAKLTETSLDKVAMQVQRLREMVSRALYLREGSVETSAVPGGWLARANMFLGFDVGGNVTLKPGTVAPPPVATSDAITTTIPGAAGVVIRTVQSKLNDEIYVEDFGAVGNYNPVTYAGADDAPAFQLALNYADSVGCAVVKHGRKHYKLGSAITVPSGVTLEGPQRTGHDGWRNLGSTPWTNPPIDPESIAGGRRIRNMTGTLWICFDAGRGDGSGGYNVTDMAGLANELTRTGAIIVRGALRSTNVFQRSFDNGLPASYTDTATWNSAWNSGQMSGLAVSIDAHDGMVEGCFIGGFMQAIHSVTVNRTNVRNVIMDCMNGIEIINAGDVSTLENIVAGVLASIGSSASSLVRRGTFIYLNGAVDGARVTNVFTFGHRTGMRCGNGAKAIQVNNFWADNTAMEMAGYYGIRLDAGCIYFAAVNVTVTNRQYGFYSAQLAGDRSTVLNFAAGNCANGAYIASGDASFYSSKLELCNIGYDNAGTGRVRVYDPSFLNGVVTPFVGNVMRGDLDIVTVKDFGAVGNGITDDNAVFAGLAADTSVLVPQGTYYCSIDTACAAFLTFAPGAILKPANGKTITLSRAFVAPDERKIFDVSLGGTFIVANRYITPGHFGAVGDGVYGATGVVGTGTDNTTVLNALSTVAIASNVEVLFNKGNFGTKAPFAITPSMKGISHRADASLVGLVTSTHGFTFAAGNYSGLKFDLPNVFSFINGVGVYLQQGCSVSRINVEVINNCLDGIRVEAAYVNQDLDNEINFNTINACTNAAGAAIRLKALVTGAHESWIQGLRIRGSFVINNKEGIIFDGPNPSNPTFNCNEFNIMAIDGNGVANSRGVTTNTGVGVTGSNVFNILGFFGNFASTYVSWSGNNPTFNIGIDDGGRNYAKWVLGGNGIMVRNMIVNKDTHRAATIAAQAASNNRAAFNAGSVVIANSMTLGFTIPNMNLGDVIDFYAYSPFTDGYSEKFWFVPHFPVGTPISVQAVEDESVNAGVDGNTIANQIHIRFRATAAVAGGPYIVTGTLHIRS